MAFSKSFPKTSDKYPVWEEVMLTGEEERKVEEEARAENIRMMKLCIDDAKKIAQGQDIAHVAVALFEKMASHNVYMKERKCKDKFDSMIYRKD